MVSTTIVSTIMLFVTGSVRFFSSMGKKSSKNALMNGFTRPHRCKIDRQQSKLRAKSSANLRFSSLFSFVIALFDAGMPPKQTDAERWMDMLETKARGEYGLHRQTCLGKPVVERTFFLNASKHEVAPLSNNCVRQTLLQVRECSDSSKEDR